VKLPDRPPRKRSETVIKAEARAAINAIPGCRVWNNPVGECDFEGQNGRTYHVCYGLAEDSADLIACCWGRFVSIEMKRPGKKPRPGQLAWMEIVRSFGGIADWADSAEKAVEIVMRCAPQPQLVP
jgi:hypothetical protein